MNKTELLALAFAKQVKAQLETNRNTDPIELVAAEYIMNNIKQETMADITWNDKDHHLTGAITSSGEHVVMLWLDDTDQDYVITAERGWLHRGALIPTDERYELRPIIGTPEAKSKTEHPQTLTTPEEFENAPVDTVAAYDPVRPYLKMTTGRWINVANAAFSATYSNEQMAEHPLGGPWTVLRWGAGK